MAARTSYNTKPVDKRLEDYLKKNQLSMAEFAGMAGVSHGTVWGILHGYHTPTEKTYKKVFDIINNSY